MLETSQHRNSVDPGVSITTQITGNLIDLSAALDTVDHLILFSHLSLVAQHWNCFFNISVITYSSVRDVLQLYKSPFDHYLLAFNPTNKMPVPSLGQFDKNHFQLRWECARWHVKVNKVIPKQSLQDNKTYNA